jgi:hypothetical protein
VRGFLEELSYALKLIAARPDAWQAYPSGDRRFVMRSYPFLIAYRPLEEGIQIIAVAHQHRRPGYWRDRDRE